MTDRLAQVLSARLGELQAATGEPDWAEVQRKARRAATRRYRLRLGVGALAAFVAVLAAMPAFGLRGQIVQFLTGAEPAPAPVVKDFSEIDVGAPPGMATGVIAGEARDVMEVLLSTGKTAVVWVAPTHAGGFCVFVSASGRRSTGGGGCDRDRSLRFAPGLEIPGPVSSEGKILAPPVIFDGDTLIHGAATVEIRFEDGESAKAPVVWVSPPIDAGFFVYEVPKTHWSAGHRPVVLVLEDADGNELARSTQVARGLGGIENRRLSPSPGARSSGH
ncbi:MAG: hypothetical protein WBB76_12065 [Gaiellaceae bacterium]